MRSTMRSLTFLSALSLSLHHALAADELGINITTAVQCSRPTKSGDDISVHYRGSLESDGSVFDESYKRGEPITFTLGIGQVIQGWDQGLMDMCPGERRTLTIPPDLAYGSWGRPPAIPGGSTLIFQTELVDIVGVKQEELHFETSTSSLVVETATATTSEQMFSIATAPPTPPGSEEEDTSNVVPGIGLPAEPLTPPDSPMTAAVENGECRLLGPFALLVQGALGAVAILSLVYKRWRESPKRPWKIFIFDVGKQVLGSCLTHVLNLAMSMLGSVDMMNSAKTAAVANAGSSGDGGNGQDRDMPNPCSFYLLNLGIDTTLGIPVLYLLLRILTVAASYTPLANPPESIKSGHYGTPPKTKWWLKQAFIYFIGLCGMKMFVWFLFSLLPWLPWVGDWALRWTKGNEALQVTFALLIFPLAMNAVQYWVIDNFIMEKKPKTDGGAGGAYERVQGEEGDDDRDDFVVGDEVDDDAESITVDAALNGKSGESVSPPTRELNHTPLSVNLDRSGSSRGVSPDGGVDGDRKNR